MLECVANLIRHDRLVYMFALAKNEYKINNRVYANQGQSLEQQTSSKMSSDGIGCNENG